MFKRIIFKKHNKNQIESPSEKMKQERLAYIDAFMDGYKQGLKEANKFKPLIDDLKKKPTMNEIRKKQGLKEIKNSSSQEVKDV